MSSWNIETWLDEIIPHFPETPKSRPLKRKRGHQDSDGVNTAKRIINGEVYIKTAGIVDSKPMASSDNQFTPPSSISQIDGAAWSSNLDPQATPRPGRSLKDRQERLRQRRRLSQSPKKSETASSSVTSNRSASPTKQRVTDLARANPCVSFKSAAQAKLSGPNKDLVERLLDASETFDERFKEKFLAWGQTTSLSRELRSIDFKTHSEPAGWEMRNWTADHFWTEVEEICDAVEKCMEQKRPEECWSDQVVAQIFRLATIQAAANGKGKTECINVKHIKVDPIELLPRLLNGTIPNAKVDYAFGLTDINKSFRHITQTLLHLYDRPSISPSTEFMLQDMPLFSYLEIKRQNSGIDPLQQLGIWSAATFSRTGNLLGELRLIDGQEVEEDQPTPLPIPLWAVSGEIWELFIGEMTPSDGIVIWGPFLDISTATPVGTMRIINTVAEILRWGDTHVRQRFESLLDSRPVDGQQLL